MAIQDEFCFLGACLHDQEGATAHLIMAIESSWFVGDGCEERRAIYHAIRKCHSDNVAPMPLAVSSTLVRLGVQTVDYSVLARMEDSVPSVEDAAGYLQRMARDYQKREMGLVGKMLYERSRAEDGSEGAMEPVEAIGGALDDLYGLLASRRSGGRYTMSDSVAKFKADIERRAAAGGFLGLGTGFGALDQLILGVEDRELLVIAGRPGMGKTSLACQMARSISLEEPTKVVGFISLEMSHSSLAQLMAAQESGLDTNVIRAGNYDAATKVALQEAMDAVREMSIIIEEPEGATTIDDLSAKVRSLGARHDLSCVFVDHLHKLRPTRFVGNRVHELEEISNGLKQIANDCGIPVFALAQLSRAVESRDNRRPRLSDLRDCGALEQDADIVVFPYRPEYYELERAKEGGGTSAGDWGGLDALEHAEMLLAKRRNGGTGVASMKFRRTSSRFEDIGSF